MTELEQICNEKIARIIGDYGKKGTNLAKKEAYSEILEFLKEQKKILCEELKIALQDKDVSSGFLLAKIDILTQLIKEISKKMLGITEN